MPIGSAAPGLLAAQTARATDETAGQIGEIQGAADQVVGAITGRIRGIGTVAVSIASAVEEQGAATQEIVRDASQAATGTGEVTGTLAAVARASELSRQSEHLPAGVRRFLDGVRAA